MFGSVLAAKFDGETPGLICGRVSRQCLIMMLFNNNFFLVHCIDLTTGCGVSVP